MKSRDLGGSLFFGCRSPAINQVTRRDGSGGSKWIDDLQHAPLCATLTSSLQRDANPFQLIDRGQTRCVRAFQ